MRCDRPVRHVSEFTMHKFDQNDRLMRVHLSHWRTHAEGPAVLQLALKAAPRWGVVRLGSPARRLLIGPEALLEGLAQKRELDPSPVGLRVHLQPG